MRSVFAICWSRSGICDASGKCRDRERRKSSWIRIHKRCFVCCVITLICSPIRTRTKKLTNAFDMFVYTVRNTSVGMCVVFESCFLSRLRTLYSRHFLFCRKTITHVLYSHSSTDHKFRIQRIKTTQVRSECWEA